MTPDNDSASNERQLGIAAPDRRLLFVCNVAWFFVSHRLPLVAAARRQGLEVFVAADVVKPGEEAPIVAAGAQFLRIPVSRGGVNPLRDLATVAALWRVMRHIRPTVVHCVTVKAVVYSGILAQLLRLPRVVAAISGLGYAFASPNGRGLTRRLVIEAYRLALSGRNTVALFQNESDRELFSALKIVTPSRSAVICGAGVDLDAFPYVPEQFTDTPGVVLPARMLRDKGIVEFCCAVREAKAAGKRFRAVLAGGLDEHNPAGMTKDELLALTGECDVEWLGHVDDVADLFANCHIVCLPSYREGAPKVLLEACAVGRAIITTDVPGCRDVVAHEVNGLLVTARSVSSLCHALMRLLDDPALRRTLGERGRERAEREFDVRSVVARTVALYCESSIS